LTAILGIDPAWTPDAPSGVALLARTNGDWRCLGLAPTYAQFLALAEGIPVDWAGRPTGSLPDVEELLRAAQRLLGTGSVDLVTIDMPLSSGVISKRRAADSAISRTFGGRGCGTHSPGAVRPGSISDRLRSEFGRLGYALGTTASPTGITPALIEVYPHPALLTLLSAAYRVPYKVSRAGRYWPDLTQVARRRKLIVAWLEILEALTLTISGANLPLPSLGSSEKLGTSELKRYEDALDALICGWIGTQYVKGQCFPYGDEAAAIWVPIGVDHADGH
jgi:predicted RNase H-like nuclease